MSRFLLLLFIFIGYHHSTLALDYPNNLDSIIGVYSDKNQLEEAVIYLDALSQKAQKEYGKQSDTVAFYLHYEAKILRELDRYDDAIKHFREVLAIYESNHTNNHVKLVHPLLNLGSTQIDLGVYKRAQATLNRCLKIAQQTAPKDFITLAQIYNSLSLAHRRLSIYPKALEFAQKALNIQSNTAKRDMEALISSYEHLSASYTELEQFEEGITMQKKALYLKQQHLPKEYLFIAKSLNKLASIYDLMGRNHEAIPYHQKSLEIVRKHKGNKHPITAICLNNLAVCYRRLGHFELAEPLLLEGTSICKATIGEKHPNTILFINNMGSLYRKMQDFERAKVYHLQALRLGQKVFGETHSDYIFIKGCLADAHIQSKNYEAGLKLLLEAAETSQAVFGERSLEVIKYYNQIAACYLLLGPDFYQQALDWIEQSIAVNAIKPIDIQAIEKHLTLLSTYTFKSTTQFLTALTTLSKIQEALYQTTNNQQFLLESYKTQKALTSFLQQFSNTVYTREDKLLTFRQATSAYSRAIGLIQDLEAIGYSDIASEAITFAEYNKSAVLSNALQGNQAINFGEIPDSLKNLERALKKETALVKKKIIESTIDENEEALNAANQALIDIRLQQDVLRKVLKDNYPKYNALKHQHKTLTTALIQKELLTPQSALLEYCVYDSAVYVIVITHNTVQLQQLPIDKNALVHSVQLFRKSLSDYHFIINQEKEAFLLYTQTAADLYKILFVPIKQYLDNVEELIIVPDDDLGHIPFETLLSTLPDQQHVNYKNLAYLLHEYTIRYSYAASLLLENKRPKRKRNNGKMLGFAASYGPNNSIAAHRSPSNQKMRQILDPLPAAAQEIEILQEQFPNGDFFFGKEANETLFKEKAADYSVLHLAMHGIVNPHYPLLSCLAFSEDYDTVENNFLEAHEISNLELYNDLVVLSACKTGYGEFEQGEGILSLARSFMYAGTPALVVSLWEVNDLSTAAIMQLFYQNITKGMTKDEALRQVKLRFIQEVDNDIAHPIYWSPFIVLGDNQPIHLKPTVAPWQWAVIGSGAVLIGLLFLLIHRHKHQRNIA